MFGNPNVEALGEDGSIVILLALNDFLLPLPKRPKELSAYDVILSFEYFIIN